MLEKYENKTEEQDFSNVITERCITRVLPEDDGCCEVTATDQFLDCSVCYNRKYNRLALLPIRQHQRKLIYEKIGIVS